MVAPWQVRLEGHPFDLEDLRDLFTSPALRVVKQDDEYWLESEALADLPPNGAEILAVAGDLLARVNGAMKLVTPNRQEVRLSGSARRPGEGGVTLVAVEAAIGRAKAGTVLAKGEPVEQPPPKTVAWSIAAARDDLVADLLHYAAQPWDWYHLYKMWEVIEERAEAGGWTSKAAAKRFTGSANRRDVAGREARHAVNAGTPPAKSKRLSIEDAVAWLLPLVERWLDERTS